MRELTLNEKYEVEGGAIFFAYFAAAYIGTFATSAGFAYGAVETMSKQNNN